MFPALVVTLREGVEAALIVGITLVYLAKTGRSDLRKMVYWALVVALVASIAGAVALSYLPINQDAIEGWVMLVAAVFVVSMVIFMMRTARKLKGEIESKVGSFASAGSRWGLFAFIFLMVFREGLETVVILKGVSLNTTELMSVPRKLISSVVLSETPLRMTTVSRPSRNTIRKMKANRPHLEPALANDPTLLSISPLSLRAVRIMKMTMLTTNTAATSMTQPSIAS